MSKVPAEVLAARKEARRVAKLPSVFDEADVQVANGKVFIDFCDGSELNGAIDPVNLLLDRLGYKRIRLTRNLLNPEGPEFAIDIDTPLSCDPGSETYHSM